MSSLVSAGGDCGCTVCGALADRGPHSGAGAPAVGGSAHRVMPKAWAQRRARWDNPARTPAYLSVGTLTGGGFIANRDTKQRRKNLDDSLGGFPGPGDCGDVVQERGCNRTARDLADVDFDELGAVASPTRARLLPGCNAIGSGLRNRTVYVSSLATGPLGTGTAASPFSFAKARDLLNTRVKMTGTTFVFLDDGPYTVADADLIDTEGGPAILVVRACGTASRPLTIKGVQPHKIPTIDGGRPNIAQSEPVSGTFPKVDRAYPLVKGLLLIDTQDVVVQDLHFTGCWAGVMALGACRFLQFQGLEVAHNAVKGFLFTATAHLSKTPFRSQGCGAAFGDVGYPMHITVEDCDIHDNGCGCDTSATNLGLGACATNITIRGNRFYAEDPTRGTDGITADGAASGHLIEGNSFVDIPSLVGGGDENSCTGTGAAGCGPYCCHDNGEGNDGDGIDLKGVWPRTALSAKRTVIRYNLFSGNASEGIVLQDGTRGVEIYGNEFVCNEKGVYLVAESTTATSAPAETDSEGYLGVWDIRIYRNVFKGNCTNGVLIRNAGMQLPSSPFGKVQSTVAGTRIRDVWVVNNTFDRQGREAVKINRNQSTDQELLVQEVYVYNNILSRSWNRHGSRMVEVFVGGSLELPELDTVALNANLYALDDMKVEAARLAAAEQGQSYSPYRDAPVVAWDSTSPATADSLQVVQRDHGRERSWLLFAGSKMSKPFNPAIKTTDTVFSGATFRIEPDSAAQGTALALAGFVHYDSGIPVPSAEDFTQALRYGKPDVGAVGTDSISKPDANFLLQPAVVPLSA